MMSSEFAWLIVHQIAANPRCPNPFSGTNNEQAPNQTRCGFREKRCSHPNDASILLLRLPKKQHPLVQFLKLFMCGAMTNSLQ